MAFDLSTPTAQLAFGVAQRAQEVQDYKAKLEAEARDRVNARLAPYGNDLSQFDSTFRSVYDPAVATQQSRAKAMQEYVVGLPELLARSQAERSSGSGGGGGGGVPSRQMPTAQEIFDYLTGGGIETKSPFYADPYTPEQNAMRNRGPRPGVRPVRDAMPRPLLPGQRPTRAIGWDGNR
jgi:hypothetical protein